MSESSSSSSGKKRIAIIPGDGIGKEVIPAAVKVLKLAAAAGGREVELTEFDWGADRYLRDGTTLPSDAVTATRVRILRLHALIQAFAWGHARLPNKLSEAASPADTFDPTTGGEFVYQPKSSAYVLYSPGADGGGRISLTERS